MRNILILLAVVSCVSCFDQLDDVGNSVKQSESIETNQVAEQVAVKNNSANKAAKNMPTLSDYPRECPEMWGIVIGASKAKVESFIQNYFHVPENPTPMYSEINHFSSPDGSTLIHAGTYKMQDNIVDQEMVASFVAGKMTQCAVRLRCADNPSEWV